MTTDDAYGVPLATPAAAALDNADLPCAFWDADLSNDPNHPDALAIQALRDESSPSERAETLKSQGNDALTRGLQLGKRFYVAEAVKLYSQALSIEGLDREAGGPALRVALLSNRAQAHLTLQNNRAALADATAATAADPAAVKAWHRAARAAGRLHEWAAAERALEGGLEAAPGHAPLLALRSELAAARAKADAAAASRAAAAAAARAPAAAVAAAIAARGVRVGLPQLDRVGTHRPSLSPDDGDGASTLLWPLVFVYPEAGGARDVVQAADERVPLSEHLDEMFGPAAPPLEWDGEGAYTRDAVELYYLSHATQPLQVPALIEALHGGWPEGVAAAPPERYGPRAARWVKVDESQALGDVLARPDVVVPGVPVFFVVARGTQYRDRFVESDGF